jgi:hypothetical protein
MADSQSRLEMVRGDSAGRSVLVIRHAILAVALLCLYLFLSRPEIILISNLGFTAWYPAVGLVFAAMLGVSPRYLPVLVLGDILASLIIYHQPIYSWSVVPAAVVGTSIYALAAYVLQHTVKIDRNLSQLSDVLRYLSPACAYGNHNDISVQVRAAAAAAEHARSLNELVSELQRRTNEMTTLNELGRFRSAHRAENGVRFGTFLRIRNHHRL